MIDAISRTLERYLLAAIPEPGPDWIEIRSLHGDGPAPVPANRLILFLYAVAEHPYLRNQPLVPADGGYRRPPLRLLLSYLITFISDDAEEGQRRLSRVLQAFHSRPRLGPAELDPTLVDQLDGLSVRLRSTTFEEMNQLWTALNRGMRLALYYDVEAALIEPAESAITPPVRRRDLEYTR
jgi:hypothetical protein